MFPSILTFSLEWVYWHTMKPIPGTKGICSQLNQDGKNKSINFNLVYYRIKHRLIKSKFSMDYIYFYNEIWSTCAASISGCQHCLHTPNLNLISSNHSNHNKVISLVTLANCLEHFIAWKSILYHWRQLLIVLLPFYCIFYCVFIALLSRINFNLPVTKFISIWPKQQLMNQFLIATTTFTTKLSPNYNFVKKYKIKSLENNKRN